MTYITDTEFFCERIDKSMPKEEIINYIIWGLKPNIIRHLCHTENNTFDEFKCNILNYERVEFITHRSNKSVSYRQ